MSKILSLAQDFEKKSK
ncbi:MbeB family mobilization protein, partial [Vibrio anguillarum]